MSVIAEWSNRRAFRSIRQLIVALFAMALIFQLTPSAHAWDSRTHKLIARLAVDALPETPLRTSLAGEENQLQEDAIAPDYTLRRKYGHAEAIHHYIDLEDYGPDPFANLNPDFATMRQRYGASTLDRSGTLPWTIERVASQIQEAWRNNDCRSMETLSGYLAHYIGDASQPLHTTRYYDGIEQDRGIHARLESATDASLAQLEPLARPQLKLVPVDSVWNVAIDEIRRAHVLIPAITQADRAARASAPADDYHAYDRALMAQEGPLLAAQIADASSVLASVWLYEWKSAGGPGICVQAASFNP
ncbi:MAG TPA: S1/P1 nuclease [Candidatus Binataceae bacterium]|nr:S1/P1 nuclease [Candidatus Binataceae bacterium]